MLKQQNGGNTANQSESSPIVLRGEKLNQFIVLCELFSLDAFDEMFITIISEAANNNELQAHSIGEMVFYYKILRKALKEGIYPLISTNN